MITVNEPVGITEIAERLRVKKNVVSNWTNRFADFPTPVIQLAQGRVWEWSNILSWATVHNRIPLLDAARVHQWRLAIGEGEGLERLSPDQKKRVLQLFFKGLLDAEEVSELDDLWRIVEATRKEGSMSQYWFIVNLDKHEFIDPSVLGDSLQLQLIVNSQGGAPAGLVTLLACSNGRSNGDIAEPSPEIGRWAGDRIAVVGDYAKAGDLARRPHYKQNKDRIETVFDRCMIGKRHANYDDFLAEEWPAIRLPSDFEAHSWDSYQQARDERVERIRDYQAFGLPLFLDVSRNVVPVLSAVTGALHDPDLGIRVHPDTEADSLLRTVATALRAGPLDNFGQVAQEVNEYLKQRSALQQMVEARKESTELS